MAFKFINEEVVRKVPGGVKFHEDRGLINIEIAHQLSELVEQNKRIADALEGVIQDEKTPLGNRMKSIRIAERTHYDR